MSFSAAFALPRSEAVFAEVVKTLRDHVWLIAPVEAYVIVTCLIATVLGRPNTISLLSYEPAFVAATPILCLGFLAGRMTYVMVVKRPARLARAIINDMRYNCLTREHILNALPVILVMPLFNSACTTLKSLIPLLHPYDWDATFSGWDSRLHFGVAPWQILQPVFGHAYMTSFANIIYCLWFFGLACSWFWQAFAVSDPRLRKQFFIAYILCFVLLGNLAAVLLASGGPCYYGRMVAGANPYAPLMQYLTDVSAHSTVNISVRLQNMLWRYYASGGFGIGSGISAMPSMHVAGATLFALLGWRTNRTLGIVLTINVVLIMLATVHLGWHYAIDGYAAVLGTIAIWGAVGAVIRRTSVSPVCAPRGASLY